MRTPGVLVLGGGGTLGEAWMSALLTGLEQEGGFDAHGCRRYIGTSAGSIVAASLVAGLAPSARLGELPDPGAPIESDREPAAQWRGALGAAGNLAGAVAAPLASLAFASGKSGGAVLRRTLLRTVPRGQRSLSELARLVERAGVRFDGRLRITAVELESGRRVVFGDSDAPAVPASVAVAASCAIPGVFSPIAFAGRTYVDGGAWSPTNMDAVEVRSGERVLCLNPTGSMRPARGALAGAFGPVSRSIAASEALVLRNRGARVRIVNPDRDCTSAMGTNLMDPRRSRAVIAAGLAQGRRLGAQRRPRAA
jgi:NTE family protein